MCRLFGSRSQLPSSVHRALVDEPNALRVQSREHRDGWGIGWWSEADAPPQLVRSAAAAHADDAFARSAALVSAPAVIAHVRKASVGPVSLENAHPFRWGPWLFAHNGTVTDFDRHRSRIEQAIDPAFLPVVVGETDSARCFALFLTRLARLVDPAGDVPIAGAAQALAETVQTIAAITDPGAATPSATTFLVGNGRLMLAFRRGRSLFAAMRPERDGCRLAQLVVASERLSPVDPWEEVPMDTMIGVDAELRPHRFTLEEALPVRCTSAA